MSHEAFLQDILIHQDPSFWIVSKPSGLLSVPGKGDLTDSLRTRLETLHPDIKLVHRLDRDTSGLMVFAIGIDAQRHLSKQFELRQTDKQYQALVLGALTGSGQIDVPVRYDPTRPPMHVADPEHPKHALTYWHALPSIQIAQQTVTPVELKPITGRSHQLRVHLAAVGHPILGDALYADAAAHVRAPRLLLHAARLAFQHPGTGQWLEASSPLPF